ncbi:Pol [Symbiodinium necroappetens]|uniref:Pol protein n=1 Tax=Symbiodinium necroappetens TaxID=1628268 RepID=A0A812L6Q9_9DINO|nr:Pol [Symbiodinium necroappetens]
MALRSDDEVFQASDSEAAPAPELSCRSPLPRSTALAEREHHYQLKRQSFVEELLKGLCWKQLERELKERFPIKQASAQLREYRKGHGRDPSRTLLYNVSEYLSPERRGDLEHMSAALRCMLEEDMLANDLEWLERLPEGPMPDRLVAMQFFQRAIYASLLEQAGAADAAMVAHLSVELASNTFYNPAMRLLWPLLSSKQQLEVQQWFFRFSAHMDEQPRPEPASSSTGPSHDPVGESDIGQALLLFLLFPLNQATLVPSPGIPSVVCAQPGNPLELQILRSIAKRAFIRAQNRAMNLGYTKYKGSLSSERNLELNTWLQTSAGRLLHVRIEADPSIDLVVGYQYAWSVCVTCRCLVVYLRLVGLLADAQPALPARELLTQSWKAATATLPRGLPIAPRQADDQPVLRLWRLRATIRELTPLARTSLRCLFRLWHCKSALQAHQRELKRICRSNKKIRFARMLQEASDSAPGLQRVYQILRTFAPKTPKRRLQLRAANGMPLCIADTVAAIRSFYDDLYHQPLASMPHLNPPDQPLQIELGEFQASLATLPPGKALPPHEAPSLLWRLASDTLSGRLLPAVNHWLAHMHLPPPSEWHIADICLLPKPHKPVAGPETLRPISLLHPVAKALATIINGRIKPHLLQLVDGLPQFSYLEGRSVQDALDRAMAHCTRVRSILNARRQNVHLKKQGHAPSPCRGGLTLSLDLQQAFDLMPRDRLLEAMQLAGIDYSLQYAIMQLHFHAQMRITHGGQSAAIDTANGVRQGCGLAPSLWCLLTCLILQHVSTQVALSDTTAYADDFLFQWIVNTPAQFDQACEHISFILRTFAHFGMKVSHTKTVVLMALKGPLAGSTARAHERMRNSWAAFNRLLPTLRPSMEAPNQPIPTEADLISAEAQMKLTQNMMATATDPSQLGTAIPSGPPGPLGEFVQASQNSTEAPSRGTSSQGSQGPAEMDTSSRDKRAAAEGDREEPTATGRPRLALETEDDQPDHSGKGYKWPRLDSKDNTRESRDGFEWQRDHRDHRSRPRQARQPSYWGGARRSERSDRTDRNERSRDTEQALLNLCSALTNLSLRHEDQMSINRSQSNYIMFLQTKGMLTVVPEMVKGIQIWKEAREQQPGTITLPLRTFLMGNWLKLLRTRFEACLATEEARKQALEMLVLDPSGAVPYLEWDAQAKAMKIKKDREPMTPDQILELVRQMEAMILAPHGIMRFHAARQLDWNVSGEVVPMMLELGIRTQEAHKLWESFGRLSRSGATRVVSTSLRGDKMGRSALANTVQRLSEELSGCSGYAILTIIATAMQR